MLTSIGLRHRVQPPDRWRAQDRRDVVIAAMLGAEEFGIGTASLIAMGCIMVRHPFEYLPGRRRDQDQTLPQSSPGSPEEGRQPLQLHRRGGARNSRQSRHPALNEVIGRTELLEQVSRGAAISTISTLNPILGPGRCRRPGALCTLEGRNEVPDSLDAQMIRTPGRCSPAGAEDALQYNIRNTLRAIGTGFLGDHPSASALAGLKPNPYHGAAAPMARPGNPLGALPVQG